MLKKVFCFMLAVITMLSIVGCSGEQSSQTMGTNTDVSTESNTELNDTSNTQPTNPSTIPESTPNSTGNENSATSSTVVSRPNNGTVSSKPSSTTSSKPNSGTVSSKPSTSKPSVSKPSTSKPITSKPSTSTPVSKEPYLVSLELIKVNKPNAMYLSNGKDIIEYAYGKDYLQCGDSFVFKVNMSDGGSDFYVFRAYGCTYTQNGNMLTATVDGSRDAIGIEIHANDKNGKEIRKGLYFNLTHKTAVTTEKPADLKQAFIAYAQRKGISHTSSGSKVDWYTKYDLSLSLTNSQIKGNDDMLEFSDFPKVTDFAEKMFWLIDQYEKKGFTLWSVRFDNQGIATVAGHPYK